LPFAPRLGVASAGRAAASAFAPSPVQGAEAGAAPEDHRDLT